MPLDGHSYLVSQGWTGSGTGLRQGAISRPLAIPQKKNLAGLGKERDEAFPFWDHLFSAASKSIQIKLSSEEDSDAEPNASVSLKRTTTGILSNRRPVTGAPADSSGSTTPDDVADTSQRLSLLATAKREAAKRGLYSRFFRGPVLGPDSPLTSDPVIVVAQDVPNSLPGGADATKEGPRPKKRKVSEGEDERRERKRLKKEKKELDKAQKKSREKSQGKEKDPDSDLIIAKEKKRKRNQELDAELLEVDLGQRDGKHRRKRKLDVEDDSASDLERARRKRERKEEKRKNEAVNSTGERKRKRKKLVE
ncbi:hypothetical protein FB451DRAFT_1405837 [Mycena latifolia]|nr:hypothetical protein FB451DRAFT_1405837 [Mycena latifolia]